MAKGFNLTAQLNLRGPSNIRPVIDNLRKQLGSINVSINPTIDPAAARNVTALQNSLGRLNSTLSQTTVLASNASRSISSLSTAIANVGSNIRTLPNNVNTATKSLNNASQAATTTKNNVTKAGNAFEYFGTQSALAVRRFAAFATVTSVIYKFTNAISSSSAEFIKFNTEIVRVSQVTDKSLKELGPLVKQITSLSTGLGVASRDLITVSSTLAQAGLSARDTEKALKALALSALAPSFDSLNDTVEGSIALMRQFGIGAKDLEGALGSVNAVAAAFAVESGDLITAIQRTGGVFAAASKGVSEGKDALNEFLAIFTSIRQTTRESAETIATGLRTIFTRIQRGKTIDALKEYGVVLTDLTGKFVGPFEATKRLAEGLARLDPRDLRFSQIVEELGGFRQIGKVIPLIQQFAVAQQALKVAQEGQGSLATDAATAQLALANRLTKVREEFNALIRSVGESKSFQTFVSLSLDLASALIRLADSAKNVLPALAAIAAFRGVRALTSFARGFGRNIVPQAASTGGKILGFSSGGVVPGSGRGDKVPALLEPGEVVMSNQAVRQYGRGNLVKMNRMASRDGERVRKVYESTRGPKQRAHIGADIQLTEENIKKYVDKDTGYKSKKFFASAKEYAGLTKTQLREGNFRISDLTATGEKKMGLKAKDRVVLKLPASWNQALREGNKDLVSQDSLSAFLSRGARSQDLFSGQYNKLSTRSKTQTAQALSAKIQNLPAKKYNKSNDSSDKPNIPSFDKDKELDSLKNVLVEQLGQAEYIDLLFRSPKGDKSKSGGRTQSRSGARKDRISKMGGGLVQRFMKGGIAQRNVGYIDYDVIANPANEAVVTKGMERSGVTGPRLYADYLTDLAVKARKDSSLQKLRAVYGVAGSGKTTLARGQGTDQGKLRKTNRFPVLTPEDIQKANEVLILSSSVSKDKLDSIFSEVDRAYTLSSTTPAEKERIKAQRASRDTTGIGLEGRTPGGTTGVGKDTAVGEALLQDRLGSRSVVLGRSDSGKLRRKRGDELVQIIKKKIGFTWGGFAPMTVGHESILDAAAAQGISPKDFIFLVGANEGINDADASSYRTAIFDQDARVLLARAGAGARGATVLPKARDFETPLGFDISGESGRRKVVLPSKGSKVFVGEEKGANLTSKYKEAGYDVASIARTGGISATKVRELIEKGDLGGLQKLLSPGVYDLISNNIGRIQNRAKVLPDIIAQVKQSQAVKIGDIEKAIQALGISRIDKKKLVDPEYAAKVQILEELRSQRDKIKSAAALEPYKLLEQLARSQPDQYGLDFSAKTAPTTKPIRTVRAAQKASIGGLIQRFMAGGRPEEIKPWGDTATVPEILRLLTFGGAAKIGRVENPRELLKKKKPTEDEKAKIKAIRDEATKTYNRRIGAGKGVQTRLAGQGLKFAAVGMFGNPFPDETYDAQGTKGTRKVLITASIMDQALAKELDADFGGGIESTAQQAAEKAMVGNITKGVLGGKQLELDFDRTLAVGADDIAALTDFRDPTIVQEKLKRATLTRLGSALVGLVKTHPELTSNMRVITARSQSTVPLIQQWLASKGLALPISQFVGVGGDAQIISESDIPALKAAQLKTGSLFVDDSGANISAAQASGKDIETYQYGAQSTIPNPNAEATVKGVLFEKMIQNLGGPGRVAGLGFDYPKGLGIAAKYFGIDPDIPTDAKRTIVGPSTIKDNIRTYLKAMRYKAGGKVSFGTGFPFPRRISNKYFKDMEKMLDTIKLEKAWEAYPKDERIIVNDERVKASSEEPFNLELFKKSFADKISRDGLFQKMGQFARYIGLPSSDLTSFLPSQIDFVNSGGVYARASFSKDPSAYGGRGLEGVDLSEFGFSEADKQDAYGYSKLIEEKKKEVEKVLKTPVQTFDDGSFRYDETKARALWDEINDLKKRYSEKLKLNSEAIAKAKESRKASAEASGRGSINMFRDVFDRNRRQSYGTLYHEMVHQLFNTLRARQADTFTQYKDRVDSLFAGDNDDLADAFDLLDGGYKSADVVYGRSYKLSGLQSLLSNAYSTKSLYGNEDPVKKQKSDIQSLDELRDINSKANAYTKARDFRPINPGVNKLLLGGGYDQNVIDKMEDNGKEEFLTTLVQNLPKLDTNLQGVLDSTLNKLLSSGGISRRSFAQGGLADATSEMASLMGGLYGNRESAQAKKQKDFGKIGLTEDGDMISAGYYKNDQRSGYVQAYKTKDNLYHVGLSKATSGYGPRLYDVVMEAVTEKGGMLTSDRSMVSEQAQKVWQYYFSNRGDVKKTPLEPENWTKNQSLIDPKLYGRRETWPPATDPAWVLQSGYSKSPSLINDPNAVVRSSKKPTVSSGQMALQYFQRANGGKLDFADGGSVPALVSNGEAYVPPKLAKKIGYGTLNRMNQADRNGMGRFSSGGISVFKGPGSGTSDSIPTSLPVGSFIIREKATKALGLNKGGSIGIKSFKDGGTNYGSVDRFTTVTDAAAKALEQAIENSMNSIVSKIAKINPTASFDSAYNQARQQTDPRVNFSLFKAAESGDQNAAQMVADAQRKQVNAIIKQIRMVDKNVSISDAKAAAERRVADAWGGLYKEIKETAQSQNALQQSSYQLSQTLKSTLTKAAGNAANSLYSLGKSAMVGVGRGIGGVGGGVLGMLGLGKGRGGGMGGGMMAMMLPMVGGMAVEQLSKSMGGETTDTGRKISSMGSQALNYGSTGAMIGSMVAPLLGPLAPLGPALGGLLGGVAGLTMGFFEAEKAGKEYAQSQRQAASDLAMEKSGAAVERFAQSGTAADRDIAIKALAESSSKEAAVGSGLMMEKGEGISDFAKRRAQTQKGGADQAEKILVTEMMKSGKTFEQLSRSMNPTEFKMLAQNIAEADQAYAYFQTQRANEIARLKSEGRGAEAAALEARTITDQEVLAKNIAERKLREQEAAFAAQRAAAASRALATSLSRAVMNLERTFDIMNQSMQRTSFQFEQSGNRLQEISSNQVSLASGQDLNRQINVLENPEAYGAAERNAALASSARMIGPQGNMTARISQFGPNARNEAMRIGNARALGGGTNAEVGADIKEVLKRQIEAAYGADTDIGRAAVNKMIANIDKAVQDAADNEPLDINAIVEDAVGPLMKASEQASKALIEANKMTILALTKLSEASQAVADAQQRQIDRTNALRDMQRESGLKTREALGIKVSGEDRIRSRTQGAAQRLGFANASDVNARNIAAARQRAIEEQGRMMASKPAMEQAASTGNVNAARALVTFNTNLASVNQRIKDFDKELEDLPQLLEANLNDVLSEIQNRVNDLESRKEAGAAFLEKLVGSTPQELQELGRAYNTLENTLRGNIITINKSQSAQMAYVTALQQGKSRQEATMDAQSAFANETKSALSLFNDLTQMTGVKGAGFDKMRADLLENFARAQGAGLQNMPMFQKVLEELRKDPNQRAQDDPVLRALIAQADAIKQAQIDAVKQQNQIDRDIQKRILEEVAAKIIQDLNTARVNINVAVQQGAAVVGATVNRAKGGLIYASKGMLVNYEPKGTDTVPAMLTPGEFVVNRAATQRNLPLLQSINSGHMSKGGVVYLANGGTPSSTAFVQDNARMQNSILRTLSADISNIQSSTNNIGSTTDTLQNSSIPNLSLQNSETYKSLDKSSENISKSSEELSSIKKSLSNFYNRFDTFSGRSKSTLASISDSIDFLVPAVVTVSDQMAEALGGPNNIQGLGTQLQAAFAGIGPVLQRALQNGIGNVGNMLGFSNGGIVYANNGMLIPYQPKGTDTVPAMLTPGEFVVNRAATQNNLPLLKAINNSKGGSISRYSSGGVVYAQDGWYQPGQPRTRLDRMMDEARNAPIRTAPPSSVGLGSASIGANTQSRAEREAGEMAYSLRYLPQEVPNESWFGPPTRKETEYERQLRLANSIGPDMSPGLESGKFVPNMFAFMDIISDIGEAAAVRGGKPPSLRSSTKLPKGVTSPLLGSRYIDREVPTPSREKAISNTQALTALFPSDTGSSSSNRQSPTGPLSPAGEPLYTLGYGMIGGPKEELLAVIQAATQNFKAGGKPATIIDMLELKDIMRNDQAIRKQLVDLQRNGIIAAQNYVDPNVDEDEGTAIIGKPNNVISIRGLLKARESINSNPDGGRLFPDHDTLGGLLGYSKDSREVFDMLQSKEIRDAVIGERSDYTAQWVQDQIANKRTMADIKQQLLEAKNKLMSEQSSEDDYILAPDDSKTSRSDRVGDRATDTTAAQRVRTYRREAIAAASDAGRSRTMPGVASPPPQSYDPSRTPMTQEEISAILLGLGPKPTSFQELTAWHRARIEKEFERDMEAKKTDRDDWVKELAIKNLERTRDEKLAVVDLLARSDEFAQQSQIRKNREFSFKRPSLGLSEETTLPYDELIAMVEAMSPESLKALAGRASLLGAGGNSAAWALDEALALYTYAGVGDPGRLFARHPNFKIQPRKSPKTEFESQFGQPIATIIGENNEYIASIIPRVSGVATSGADATGIGMIKGSKALDLLSLIGSYDENVFIRLFEDQLRLAKGNYGKGLSDAKLENMVFGQNRIVPIDVGGSGEKPIETFPTGQPFTEQSDLQSVILSDAWLKIMESQLSGPRRHGGGTLHNSIMELLATNPKAFLDKLSDFEYFPYEEDPRSNSNAILGDTARAAYIKIQQRILEKIRSAHKKVKQTYSSSGTEGSAQTADSSAVRKLLSSIVGPDRRSQDKINTILQSDKALSSLDSILKQQNINPKQLSYLSSGLESLVFDYGNEVIKITSAIKKPLLPLVNPVTAEVPIAGSNFRLTREAKLITEGVTSKDVQDMINTIWTEHGFNWTDAGTRQMGFHPETRQPLVFDGNFVPIDKTKPPRRMEPERISGVTKPEPPPLPPPTRKQNGGIIYASKGMLVNYQPRGTDTVPAMLTPGEFVVNKEATQANLPLLRSINSGYYAAGDLVVPQNQLMSSIRNRSMQRNIAGLDEKTWFLASKYGRRQQPGNFSGVVLEVAPGTAIPGATPANPNDENRNKEDPTGLGNWQLAARVQANNLKQATEAMTTLVGNDAWRKKSQLISGAQLKNLMKFRENKVNNADQLVREIQYQRNLPSISGTFTNVAAAVGHGTPVDSGAQPGVDTAGVNARANYLVTAIRANPAQAEGTVASMSKRIAAGIGASKTIDTAIQILRKDKRYAKRDPALIEAKEWLEKQKLMYQQELNYLGTVWRQASTILGTPVAGQPLIRLPALNITPQLYTPESFPGITGTFKPIPFKRGGIVYASTGMLVNYEPKGTDTVPAMLTPGEFVVNKASTQANLPLLQSINSGQYNKGGRISYLADGTPGVDAFNKQMMLLTEILKISADNLQISFTNIIQKLNNFNIPEQNNGGVSNTNGSGSLAAIAALGTKLDQFILQLQQSIPPSITLEVPQPIPVNVNINGAAALQNLLSGPLSSMIQNIISQAFNAESRKREGQ